MLDPLSATITAVCAGVFGIISTVMLISSKKKLNSLNQEFQDQQAKRILDQESIRKKLDQEFQDQQARQKAERESTQKRLDNIFQERLTELQNALNRERGKEIAEFKHQLHQQLVALENNLESRRQKEIEDFKYQLEWKYKNEEKYREILTALLNKLDAAHESFHRLGDKLLTLEDQEFIEVTGPALGRLSDFISHTKENESLNLTDEHKLALAEIKKSFTLIFLMLSDKTKERQQKEEGLKEALHILSQQVKGFRKSVKNFMSLPQHQNNHTLLP